MGLLCRVGLHRWRVSRWHPYWDGARRCVEGFERCGRAGCDAERSLRAVGGPAMSANSDQGATP